MDRAAHLLWDNPPKIFEDTFALPLSGCADEAALRTRIDARSAALAAIAGPNLAQAAFTFARSLVAMRARYVEDELARRCAICDLGRRTRFLRSSPPGTGQRPASV